MLVYNADIKIRIFSLA